MRLINGDEQEIQNATSVSTKEIFRLKDADYAELASNCTNFVKNRGYITAPLSAAEENFPLAFSILMYKDVEQFERLLRAIYRPHNFYCVHVDSKSKHDVRRGVNAVTSCFENVFVLEKSFDVQWAYFSVVEPDLLCMKELLKHRKWK